MTSRTTGHSTNTDRCCTRGWRARWEAARGVHASNDLDRGRLDPVQLAYVQQGGGHRLEHSRIPQGPGVERSQTGDAGDDRCRLGEDLPGLRGDQDVAVQAGVDIDQFRCGYRVKSRSDS